MGRPRYRYPFAQVTCIGFPSGPRPPSRGSGSVSGGASGPEAPGTKTAWVLPGFVLIRMDQSLAHSMMMSMQACTADVEAHGISTSSANAWQWMVTLGSGVPFSLAGAVRVTPSLEALSFRSSGSK